MEVMVLGSVQTAESNYNHKINSKTGQNNKITPLKTKSKQGSDNPTNLIQKGGRCFKVRLLNYDKLSNVSPSKSQDLSFLFISIFFQNQI